MDQMIMQDRDLALEESMEKILELIEDKKYFMVRDEMLKYNEADIAEMFEELFDDEDIFESTIVCYRLLPKAVSVEVFAFLPVDDQLKIVEKITTKELNYIVQELDFKDYVYTSMWAEDTADKNGVYDVDDSVVGIIRTDGPVISFNGAWAQNIGVSETYIDFMGTKGGIRLNYCGDFTYYSTKDGMLTSMQTESRHNNFYDEEIKSFINCVKTREHNQAYIDYAIETSKIMQAIYDSSDSHKEIAIE